MFINFLPPPKKIPPSQRYQTKLFVPQEPMCPRKDQDGVNTRTNPVRLDSHSAAASGVGKEMHEDDQTMPSTPISCSSIMRKEPFSQAPIPSKSLLCRAALWLVVAPLLAHTHPDVGEKDPKRTRWVCAPFEKPMALNSPPPMGHACSRSVS